MNNISNLIEEYDSRIREMNVAFGGEVRGKKGMLVESLTSKMVLLSWSQLGCDPKRISINNKRIKIPIQEEYLNKQENLDEIKDSYFSCSVDRHIFIDGKFVAGIECKSYTELAMLKRILFDFNLLKTKHPNIDCLLVQLESNFGNSNFGFHTLKSYFPKVELEVITLLEGERNSKKPIHKPEFYKPLKSEDIQSSINKISEFLEKYV